MLDFNNLIPATRNLVVVFDIRYGEIVGQAFDQTAGTLPAFLAIPNDDGKSQSDMQLRAPLKCSR